MVPVLILLSVFLLATAYVAKRGDNELREQAATGFDAASAAEDAGIGRVLLGLARPVSSLPIAHLNPESASYKQLRTKLAAAGGMYSGEVVVFVSIQIFAAFISALVFLGLLAAGASGAMLLGGALGGLALVAYPYSRVHEAAKKRSLAVNTGLPEFAELLLMPLSSGYGILPALSFTADRVDGPVSDEVKAMIDVIQARVRTEQEAFADCAERLGTPAAQSFFTALAQAYLEGVRVVDNLRGQAEQLRKADYERMREQTKRLPVKLAIVIGLHLVPTLLLVCLFPLFATLGNL